MCGRGSSSYRLWWKDLSLGCSRTKSTMRRRMSATELAVEATMESAGTPNGECCSFPGEHKTANHCTAPGDKSQSLVKRCRSKLREPIAVHCPDTRANHCTQARHESQSLYTGQAEESIIARCPKSGANFKVAVHKKLQVTIQHSLFVLARISSLIMQNCRCCFCFGIPAG